MGHFPNQPKMANYAQILIIKMMMENEHKN